MDVLRTLEKQSGLLRLIVHLAEDGERLLTAVLGDTDISVHQLYANIKKGKELSLISTKIDRDAYPNWNILSCTAAGKHVAKKLKEIEGIIASEQA